MQKSHFSLLKKLKNTSSAQLWVSAHCSLAEKQAPELLPSGGNMTARWRWNGRYELGRKGTKLAKSPERWPGVCFLRRGKKWGGLVRWQKNEWGEWDREIETERERERERESGSCEWRWQQAKGGGGGARTLGRKTYVR